jgi:hypothetical protein
MPLHYNHVWTVANVTDRIEQHGYVFIKYEEHVSVYLYPRSYYQEVWFYDGMIDRAADYALLTNAATPPRPEYDPKGGTIGFVVMLPYRAKNVRRASRLEAVS